VPAALRLRSLRVRFNEPGSGTLRAFINPLVQREELPAGTTRTAPRDVYSGSER